MKSRLQLIYSPLLLTIIFFCVNCTDNKTYHSPKGYDLAHPVKYNLSDALTEISGIAFHKGKSDTLFAEQDEEGELFYFKPGSSNIQHKNFGKSGDYEDVAISGAQVIMLRSDGVLFTFPLSSIQNSETIDAVKWKDLVPKGEYEGLYADDSARLVYVLCKHCGIDKGGKSTTGYILKLSGEGTLESGRQFKIDVKQIEDLAGLKKLAFHPSALSQNPISKEWFILSSVNRLLVLADANWNIKEVFPLDPALFGQPEGMAFDQENNLYISNEGDKLRPGNVLKFEFKKSN